MIKLHYEIAQLLSCIFILCFWNYYIIHQLKNNNVIHWIGIVSKILSCVLTWIVLRLAKRFTVLELAEYFLWKPYISRIRNSIFSQYIFLLFTDYIANGYVSSADQLTALEFSRLNKNLKDISVYALSRAITYVPTKKLQDILNKQSPDDININSQTPSHIYGEQLFTLLSNLLYKHKSNTTKAKFFTSRISNTGELEFEPNLEKKDSLKKTNSSTDSLNEIINKHTNTLPFSSFEQIMMKPLIRQIMILFESKDSISKKDFCQTFTRIHKERKSLHSSMKDYESIIWKMGHIFSGIMYIALFFISLWIFNINIQKLTVTWLSVFLGLSFMFSSTCTSFIESVTFIFIRHNYDVGDRVIFTEDNTPINCLVTKINLLDTVFKTWDNRWFSVPNQMLSKKLIYNDRRSGNSFVKLDYSVSPNTTIEKINTLQEQLRLWVLTKKSLTIISESIELSFRDLVNPNILLIAIGYEQTTNFQESSQFWKNRDSFTKELTRLSVELNIALNMSSNLSLIT